jgi:glycosyltransferase involved in cell wall biosynthesis
MKVYGYMQSWKPILATDLPTHCQVLDASTSMLVAPNPEAFAAGWVRLLQDPDLRDRLGTAAAARLEERYSLPRFRARLLEAYADFAQG